MTSSQYKRKKSLRGNKKNRSLEMTTSERESEAWRLKAANMRMKKQIEE